MGAYHSSDAGDEKDFERTKDLFGPSQIDHQIRQAIQFCWVGLPKENQSADEVERQIRRLVDRALRDLREDCAEFGRGSEDAST